VSEIQRSDFRQHSSQSTVLVSQHRPRSAAHPRQGSAEADGGHAKTAAAPPKPPSVTTFTSLPGPAILVLWTSSSFLVDLRTSPSLWAYGLCYPGGPSSSLSEVVEFFTRQRTVFLLEQLGRFKVSAACSAIACFTPPGHSTWPRHTPRQEGDDQTAASDLQLLWHRRPVRPGALRPRRQ
jgi:hypothetical protein